MQKLIIATIGFVSAAFAPLHAKVYSFADFSADFKKQPVVTQATSDDGIPYTDYKMVFKDGVIGVTAYAMTANVPSNIEFQYGKAVGDAKGTVDRNNGDVKGYPSVAFRYITSEKGYLSFKVYVYATDRVFVFSVVTDRSNNDPAYETLTSFIASINIKSPPATTTTSAPPVGLGVPVTNGDYIGEI